jgi:hypothetical protein
MRMRQAEARLPYKSKAELERDNWMTLIEAVSQICSVDNCNETDARRQLVAALRDGLRPLRWERERGDRTPRSGYSPVMVPDDAPPLGRDWQKAEIRWETGRVRDDWGEYNSGKWRVLLIHRLDVARHWPTSKPSNAVGIDSSDATNVLPFAGRKTGPKTGKTQSIINAMNEDIEAGRLSTDALRAMTDKELVSKYGERFSSERTTCREARKRLLSEFDGINPVK